MNEFKNTVDVTSKDVFSDASPAMIGAINKQIPEFFVLLDEWHPNQRQHANVTATLRKLGMSKRYREMERKLFQMRRSADAFTFRIMRMRLEKK